MFYFFCLCSVFLFWQLQNLVRNQPLMEAIHPSDFSGDVAGDSPFIVAPFVSGGFAFGLCFVTQQLVSFLVCQSFRRKVERERERESVAFCGCKYSEPLSRGYVSWSLIGVCGTSLSYSLAFYKFISLVDDADNL